ncbi:Uncharacterized protein APZ42_020892 [Daphnia magna]|uniref:Uncharacterized protein n=1 Tax=Daphnia magna TaxID=35525 RepID=A0A164X547_9CRUS|nr:Uncharacterized protein APZ42_020892 [Daphnia magna]
MLLKWGIWIAFATAIQRAELLFFPENIAVVKVFCCLCVIELD